MFKLKQSTSHLFCAIAAALCSVTLPVNVAQSTISMADSVRDIGGFTAHRISDDQKTWPVFLRQKYLRESKELSQTIDACRKGVPCPPRLNGFIHMLDEASADTNPMHKIMIINAWVTLSLTYDSDEEARPLKNLQHYSLQHTLLTGKGICDEYSMLKLYALRHTGFSQTEAFWVTLSEHHMPISFNTQNEKPDIHAAAIAKIGGTFWALDFFTNPYRFPEKDRTLYEASLVEQLPSYINFSGHSHYPNTVKYPFLILNDMSQYTLGTDTAKVHNNESMKRLPAFIHLPDGILSAPDTITVLAHPEQFKSLDEAYELNAPLPPRQNTTVASARLLNHGG